MAVSGQRVLLGMSTHEATGNDVGHGVRRALAARYERRTDPVSRRRHARGLLIESAPRGSVERLGARGGASAARANSMATLEGTVIAETTGQGFSIFQPSSLSVGWSPPDSSSNIDVPLSPVP